MHGISSDISQMERGMIYYTKYTNNTLYNYIIINL
jgi:hypothetical protein